MTANHHAMSVLSLPPAGAGSHGNGEAPGATAPSLVVVDPHAPVRDGLPLLLRAERIDVLASAATPSGGERLVERHAPDVALVSLHRGDDDGLAVVRRLVGLATRTAVVLYTDEEHGAQVTAAMHAGAAGVVTKRRPIAELAAALRVVASGGLWFNEGAEPGVAPEPEPAPGAPLRTAALSSAELRVLALVAGGSSTEEMAGALMLSPHTVRTHLRNVMRKLEASSRAHAVAIAIREAAIQV